MRRLHGCIIYVCTMKEGSDKVGPGERILQKYPKTWTTKTNLTYRHNIDQIYNPTHINRPSGSFLSAMLVIQENQADGDGTNNN